MATMPAAMPRRRQRRRREPAPLRGARRFLPRRGRADGRTASATRRCADRAGCHRSDQLAALMAVGGRSRSVVHWRTSLGDRRSPGRGRFFGLGFVHQVLQLPSIERLIEGGFDAGFGVGDARVGRNALKIKTVLLAGRPDGVEQQLERRGIERPGGHPSRRLVGGCGQQPAAGQRLEHAFHRFLRHAQLAAQAFRRGRPLAGVERLADGLNDREGEALAGADAENDLAGCRSACTRDADDRRRWPSPAAGSSSSDRAR